MSKILTSCVRALRRPVLNVSALAAVAIVTVGVMAPGSAQAHDTTGVCNESWSSSFALSNEYRNARTMFFGWNALDENGEVAECPPGSYPGSTSNPDDPPESAMRWDDFGYDQPCWFWRRLCGNHYIRWEPDWGRSRVWFEEWGDAQPESGCDPGDGKGAGFVTAGAGYSSPNCQDWANGELDTMTLDDASVQANLWVQHFEDGEPVIFDLNAVQILGGEPLYDNDTGELLVPGGTAILAVKTGPRDEDWFIQDPIPPNGEIPGLPGEYYYWDVSDWAFEVERLVMRSDPSGTQVSWGGFSYETPSYSGWEPIDVCGNGACSATETCDTCEEDCGQCGVPEAQVPANDIDNCTLARDCTLEPWGIDINANTGYLWNVDGGSGGSVDLYLGVAANSGTRSMGLLVNGSQVGVLIAAVAQMPRPGGGELGPFDVTLNAGNNTVELVDNQGTAELDAHYLRVESEQGFCGNGVCSSSENCDVCAMDCGACPVPSQYQPATVDGCTGSENCTPESWGVDLNDGTGYRWTLDGGMGGSVNLYLKVAVSSGTRSMGLALNGTQIAILTRTSTQAPRPTGQELGPYVVTLNAGPNTLELLDNRGTAEFDVHYVRLDNAEVPGTPCTNVCSNPTSITWAASYQSGNLGAGAICRETTKTLSGGNCSNFAGGRQLVVNGTTMACNGQNWPSVPAPVNGGYCVTATAGNHSYAAFTLW